MALMVLLPSLLLNAHVPPVAGQVAPTENRAMRSAVDPQGRVWAVWEADDGNDTDVYYSRWNGSDWQRPRPLSADPEAWERSPSLAVDADGTLWAAWSRGTGPGQTSIWVSHWRPSGWLPPAQVPGTAALTGGDPALAPAAEGGLWLAWVGHDGTDREIFVSRWDGNAWSAAQRVGTDDTDPLAYDSHPALAADSSGAAWLAWTSHEGTLNDEIHASHWDGAAWSPQQQVSSGDGTPDAWPSVALDVAGQPWIAWHGIVEEDSYPWRIFVSQWSASDSAWGEEVLASSPASLPVDEQHPSLALDGKGQMHLAWAIEGELSGIAHTATDGTGWAPPTWTGTVPAIQGPGILVDEEPWLLWLAPDGLQTAPLQQEPVLELRELLPRDLPPTGESISTLSMVIPNRHLAHGDSITSGGYPNTTGELVVPYPTLLDELLDTNSVQSEVINWGKPGEKARAAEARIRTGVQTYTPQIVEILEGTNDVSNNYDAAETSFALVKLIWEAKNESGVPGVQVIVGTIPPRRDDKNPLAYETNQEIIAWARRPIVNAPVADVWQAFYDYGPWEQFYIDNVHPGTAGLQIIAETFFQKIRDVGWIVVDNTPPTAWITSLPAQSQCPTVPVAWTGDDGAGSGVASFDVQVQDNWGAWTNWLVETPNQSSTYVNAQAGHTLRFQVRARDQVGNLGPFSLPAQTLVIDNIPPSTVSVLPLPPAQKAPFTVSWSGTDTCDPQLTFDVKYCVGDACTGPAGTWNNWQTATTSTSAIFNPAAPQYGESYYFRARASDDAGNGKDSALVSTRLARFTLGGDIHTVRDKPVALATVTAADALAVDTLIGGGFLAYVAGAGTYDLAADRDGFGDLPPMYAVSVTSADVGGLEFVLPPLDDVVQDGGFESGTLSAWQPGGAVSPCPVAGHTGDGAVCLGGGVGTSTLSQSLSLPAALTNATLSFMVKLDGSSGSNSIQVDLVGTSQSWTVPVSPDGWTHVWYDVGSAVGQGATLTFTVSGSPVVLLDEVSLGSAASGGGWTFMAIVSRAATP